MRTTVIPAQITTVEDRIAGNLNLTQIILLMIPVIFITIVFAVFPPKLHIALYKFPIVILISAICVILSLRIKGKVVLNWLSVLVNYNLRPKYYVYDKNDSYLRNLYLPEQEKKQNTLFSFKFKKTEKKKEINIDAKHFGIKELMELRPFINNPNYVLSLKPGRKGGLYVHLEQIKK